MTISERKRDRSVMMSSVMPSLKYCCSGLPLMLSNGSTAIDGGSVVTLGRRDRPRANDAVDARGLGDVLKGLSTKILEASADLVFHIIVGGAGDQYAGWLGFAFQTGSNVHDIAIAIATLNDHIAQIHADTKHDASIIGLTFIRLGHRMLQINGALHGIDRTAELYQNAIVGDLEDTLSMPSHKRLQ